MTIGIILMFSGLLTLAAIVICCIVERLIDNAVDDCMQYMKCLFEWYKQEEGEGDNE